MINLFIFLNIFLNLFIYSNFKPKDGDYFPDEIKKVFKEKTNYFNQDFKTLEEAISGLHIIDVKFVTPLENLVLDERNFTWSNGIYFSYEILKYNGQKSIIIRNLFMNYKNVLFEENKDPDLYTEGLSWSDNGLYSFTSNNYNGVFSVSMGDINGGFLNKKFLESGFSKWDKDNLIFISSENGYGNIFCYNIVTEKYDRLTKFDSPGHTNIYPEISDDKIVFSSGNGSNHQIMLMKKKTDGKWTNARFLTKADDMDLLYPKISNDGKKIAFYGCKTIENNCIWNIYLIDSDPKTPYNNKDLDKKLIIKNANLDPKGIVWTFDDKKIFYVMRDYSKFNPIYMYDIDTNVNYMLDIGTKMHVDLDLSKYGILSFSSQIETTYKIILILTNQSIFLQNV